MGCFAKGRVPLARLGVPQGCSRKGTGTLCAMLP